MELIKLEYNIPFLYSAPFEYTVNDKNKSIDLQFKVGHYDDELLFMEANWVKFFSLDNCEKESQNLNCHIPKENLDVIANATNTFMINHIDKFGKYNNFDFVCRVHINYTANTKQDIYFKLEKLQEKTVDQNSFVTFSTNITNLPNIISEIFTLYINSTIKTKCFFIKHDESTPLYLTCLTEYASNITLGEIKGFRKDNIHYKYNFILVPGKNEELISITKKESSFIMHSFSTILDFTKNDSDFELYLLVDSLEPMKNISLNVDKGDLKCVDLINI